MFRAALYTRVSTNDDALGEYAVRLGWAVAMQVSEIGSGAERRQSREPLIEQRAAVKLTWCWCGVWIAGAGQLQICWPRCRN